jgi:Uma2 family endonuclease
MATLPKVLTYEEWLRMPPVEDGRDEVVNGELRSMPPTRFPHAAVIEALIAALLPQTDRKKIQILGSNFGLMINVEPLTCRSPDLAIFWREKVVIQDGLYYSPPDLIVEILSPSETRRRKEEKLVDYLKIRVPEVWVLSPEAEAVEILVLRDGRFERKGIFVDGAIEPTKFPGVTIDIPSIWPE